MLFDTHTHLDDRKFDEDREEVIERIQKSGVSLAVNIGADMESSKRSVELSEKYDFLYAAVGVHPCDTGSMTDRDLEELEKLAKREKVVAIGEIGLDYYWDDVPRDIQKEWFRKQLLLAKKLDMPYIIHDRDAHADTVEIIKEVGYGNGVMHCFSGSVEMAEIMVKMGLYISIAGQVTFKNAQKVKDVAMAVPLDKLLIETDSPYLTPEPYRGKRNDSANVRFTCEKIAELRGMTFDELAKITLSNGKKFYRIGD